MDLTSGYPWWPVKNGLLETYPPLEADTSCDVLVLGGGITGALVAHHLVAAGFDTIVIDKREIGTGSTAASTGLLQYEIDTPLSELGRMVGKEHAARAYLACLEALGLLAEHSVELGQGEDLIRRHESLFLATRRGQRKLFEEEYRLRSQLGIRVDLLEKRDIAARFHFTRPAALLSYDAAAVDAYRFTHATLSAARGSGLRVFDRSEVTGITTDKSGVTVTTLRKAVVRARNLVFAAGYESLSYLQPPPAKLISTYAIVSEPMGPIKGWYDRPLIWECADPYFYMRGTADGRVMIGGEDEKFRNPVARDRLIGRKAKQLREKFARLFPDSPLEVAFSWTGTFGVTPDGLAYIGQTPEWSHAWFALCYGGNGITYAILAAEIIRDGLLGKRHRYADLFAFDRPSAA